MERSASAPDRVNELDLLRFIAALAVVLFHYAFRGHAGGMSAMPYPLLVPVARYGYLGVNLFFLISGFVILMTASGGSLKGFVVSRATRLYPAFWASCTLTFAAIAALGGPHFTATAGQYFVNMTLLSGFVGVPPIDGVYWSLFVELKFYGLVALMLVAGWIGQAQALLVLWLAAAALATVVPLGILGSLLIVDFAPYFVAGAMCFLVWQRGPSKLRIATIAAALPLALYRAAADITAFERSHGAGTGGDPGTTFVVLTLCFAVMLAIALRRTGMLGRQRWLTLGALTYPLYLLHQDIGYMIFNAAWPAVDAHVLFWGTLGVMLVAAYAIHVLVERRLAPPMKRLLGAVFDVWRPRAAQRNQS